MANEKNGKATENTVVTEQKVNEEKRLIVEREKFTAKDGREMWGYAVYGKGPNGRETKVDFNAYDQGGYEVLDMVFDIKPTAELEMHDETISDGETGDCGCSEFSRRRRHRRAPAVSTLDRRVLGSAPCSVRILGQ